MPMKNRPLATLASAGLAVALTACATPSQAQPPTPGPALWRVSDADTTLYLFGLPHMMDADTEWRNAAFDAALGQADTILLEADRTSSQAQSAIQQAVPQLGVYQDGRTLNNVLDADTRSEAERVAGSLGVPFQALQPLKPWLAANQLQSVLVQRSGLMHPLTPAAVITAEAAEADTPVTYFEEPTALLVAISRLPEDSSVRMFEQALDEIENDPDQPRRILAMWTAGDVEALTEAFHGEGRWVDETVRSTMLLDRNDRWEARLETLMDSETGVHFAAIGVGHLIGEDSLVAGLQAAGYTVTRQ